MNKYLKVSGIFSVIEIMSLSCALGMEQIPKRIPSHTLPTAAVQVFDESNGLLCIQENKQDGQLYYTVHYTGSSDDFKMISDLKTEESVEMWAAQESPELHKIDPTLMHSAFFSYREMPAIFHVFHPIYLQYNIWILCGSKEFNIIKENDEIFRIQEIDERGETNVFCDLAYLKKFPQRKHLYHSKPVEIEAAYAEEAINTFMEESPTTLCFLSCFNRHGIAIVDAQTAAKHQTGFPDKGLDLYYAKPGDITFELIKLKDTPSNGEMLGMLMSELFYSFQNSEQSIDLVYFPVRNKAFLNGEEATVLTQGVIASNVAQWNILLSKQIVEENQNNSDPKQFYTIYKG